MTDPSYDEVSAYHEAGHVVFAYLFNIPVKCVTIKKTPCFRYTYYGMLKIIFKKRVARIILAAGLFVQQKYFPLVNDSRDGQTDKKRFDLISKRDPAFNLSEAKSVLDKHFEDPVIRYKIEILSHELLKERTLNGDKIKKILDAAVLQNS